MFVRQGAGKRRRARAGVAAAVGALALVATACGGGSDEPSGGGAQEASGKPVETTAAPEATPLDVVLASADRTAEAKSSRVAVTVAAEGTPTPVGLTGEGAFDYESQRGTLTLDLSSLGLPGGGQAEVRTMGSDFFMRIPGLAQQLGGKEWLAVNLDEVGRQAGVDLEQLRQLREQGDPTAALGYLKGTSNDVRVVGEEDVRGERTTHYAATVDLAKAAAQAPPEARPAIEKAAQQLGTNTVPVEVWVDGEGRTRRMVQTFDLSKVAASGTAGATGTAKATVELFDFGIPVDVQAPPADQVADLGELMQRAGAATTTTSS